jgi:hypothetical protein
MWLCGAAGSSRLSCNRQGGVSIHLYDTCISAARAPLLEGRDPFVPRFPGEEHPLDTFYLLPAVNPYYI